MSQTSNVWALVRRQTVLANPKSAVDIFQTFGAGTHPGLFSSGVLRARLRNQVPKTQQNVTPSTECYAGRSKAARQGRPDVPSHVSCVKNRAVPASHPKILFLCHVTHAALDHSTHYTPLDITSRLFQTLNVPSYNTKREPELHGYQLSEAAHVFKSEPLSC